MSNLLFEISQHSFMHKQCGSNEDEDDWEDKLVAHGGKTTLEVVVVWAKKGSDLEQRH